MRDLERAFGILPLPRCSRKHGDRPLRYTLRASWQTRNPVFGGEGRSLGASEIESFQIFSRVSVGRRGKSRNSSQVDTSISILRYEVYTSRKEEVRAGWNDKCLAGHVSSLPSGAEKLRCDAPPLNGLSTSQLCSTLLHLLTSINAKRKLGSEAYYIDIETY